MATSDFYEDRRFCRACRRYANYLQSPNAAYCSTCGERVALFSPDDLARFRSALRPERPQGPRSTRAELDRRTSA